MEECGRERTVDIEEYADTMEKNLGHSDCCHRHCVIDARATREERSWREIERA